MSTTINKAFKKQPAQMKISQILRKAAQLLETDPDIEYGCYAISKVQDNNKFDITEVHNFYESLYKTIPQPAWFTIQYWVEFNSRAQPEELISARIIALCLAADIAESEGK